MDHRKRIDMTPWEFAWTAIAILGLGMLAGWALFGTPEFAKTIVEAGNGAEWLAAIGTWVIGSGAWRYARDAHRHRVAESISSREREIRSHRGRLSDLMSKAAFSIGIADVIQGYISKPPAEQTQLALRVQLNVTLDALEDIVWSDADRACLDETTGPLFAAYTGAMKWYVMGAKARVKAVKNELIAITDYTREGLPDLLADAVKLSKATEKFALALNKARMDIS